MWSEHHDRVRPEWLDGNGHMNLAFYVLVFDRGTDAWLNMAGLGAAHRSATGHGVFAVESHTVYRQEVGLGAPLCVKTRLAAAERKRLHLLHEMSSETQEVARQEVLFVHVDLRTRRSVGLPEGKAAEIAALAPAEALPSWVGRHVGQAR